MQKQVYGRDANGVMCHHYIDLGPGKGVPGHGGRVQPGVIMGGPPVTRDNVSPNGGVKQTRKPQAA